MVSRDEAFEKANSFVQHLCDDEGGSSTFLNERTVEFEWGWMFVWEITKPDSSQKCFLIVDRLDGRYQPVGTGGLNIAVMHLMAAREQK